MLRKRDAQYAVRVRVVKWCDVDAMPGCVTIRPTDPLTGSRVALQGRNCAISHQIKAARTTFHHPAPSEQVGHQVTVLLHGCPDGSRCPSSLELLRPISHSIWSLWQEEQKEDRDGRDSPSPLLSPSGCRRSSEYQLLIPSFLAGWRLVPCLVFAGDSYYCVAS